jgi:hypothetical protein
MAAVAALRPGSAPRRRFSVTPGETALVTLKQRKRALPLTLRLAPVQTSVRKMDTVSLAFPLTVENPSATSLTTLAALLTSGRLTR